MRGFLPFVLLSSLALAQQPAPAAQPSVEGLPSSLPPGRANVAVDVDRLLPALPPLPSGEATRVGGTIKNLDSVLDKFVIQPFGGGEIKVVFDGRTGIYRGAAKVPSRELRNGERVSLDTVLDGTHIFARNIHILAAATGESHGQVVSYEAGKNELLLRDPLSPRTVQLRFAPYTLVLREGVAVSRQDLRPGDLVAAEFVSDGDGHVFANRISILATPGRAFLFVGRVTYLDLHRGLLVVTDPRTQTSYEIHFNQNVLPIPSNLQEGSNVTVTASFEGSRYLAQTMAVNPPSGQ